MFVYYGHREMTRKGDVCLLCPRVFRRALPRRYSGGTGVKLARGDCYALGGRGVCLGKQVYRHTEYCSSIAMATVPILKPCVSDEECLFDKCSSNINEALLSDILSMKSYLKSINTMRISSRSVKKPFFKVRFGSAGIHFYNRRNGLNILIDEIRVPETSWAIAPRHVSIALTNACDLACPYCFAPKDVASLGYTSVIKWLTQLDRNGCLGVGFGGGEPTLFPHFADLCRYAAKMTTLSISVTTHGHNLSDEIVAAIKENVNFVRISLDGIGSMYEVLRKRSFAALLRNIEIIRPLAPFGFNYIVNSHTLSSLNEATKLAAEVGASDFLLLPEQPVRGIGGIDPTTNEAFRLWVNNYHGIVPLSVSQVGSEHLPICDPTKRETGLCAYAHIDASGILKRTSFDSKGVKIGVDGVLQALAELRKRQEDQT